MSYSYTKRHPASVMLASALVLTLATSSSYGASSTLDTSRKETKWYEINIAIFKQSTPGFQVEQWRPRDQLSLAYPPRTASLDDDSYDQVDFEAIKLEPYIKDVFDAEGLALVASHSVNQQADPRFSAKPQSSLRITETVTPVSSTTLLSNEDVEDAVVTPLSFRSITTSDEEFNVALRRLTNSRAYKILVKKTWRQPGLPADKAIPVLIQGGKEFESDYELDGTVEISLSRYLHVQSNLWLSDYVQRVEYVNAWWEEQATADTFDDTNAESTILQDQSIAPIPQNLNGMPISTAIGERNIDQNLAETRTYYEATRTVKLDESRRMRSNELHYLDHPLFGMLIKITVYEPPQPEDEPNTLQTLPMSDAATTNIKSQQE